MKTFIEFIKFIFLLFGFDVDDKFSTNPRMSRILSIWKFLNPTLMIIGSIQMWIHYCVLSNEAMTMEIAKIIFGFLFLAKGIAGYLTVVATRKSSVELLQKIEKVFTKITKNDQKIEDEKIVKNVFNLVQKTLATIFTAIVLNGLMSFIALPTKSQPEDPSMLRMWFPEFFNNYHLFNSIYSYCILNLFSLCNLIAPDLISITTAYLAASFDKLGDKVKDVIDGTESRSFLETKKQLAECVDLHSELIKLADESNRLYGPFNLTFLVLISMGICVFGILMMVSDMMTTLMMIVATIAYFLEISLFCMTGDSLEDRSTKIARVIQDSDYYKVDPLLKKNLILMIQVSNRPKSISALGFFKFNWKSCSFIAETTYSYLTILRRLLKL